MITKELFVYIIGLCFLYARILILNAKIEEIRNFKVSINDMKFSIDVKNDDVKAHIEK